MNNAQKKVASDAGFSKFLKLCNELYLGYGECYVGDDERKDRLIKAAYLQGWNDAEDAHGEKPKKRYEKCGEVGCSYCDEENA